VVLFSMTTNFIVLFGLALVLVCAMTRAQDRIKPAWAQRLKGWHKLFGVIAFILTLLIVLTPEFFALGLLGDAAFFDMLVLALSLQLHTFAARAFRACVNVLARSFRWIVIPSPGLSYLWMVSTVAAGTIVATIQKAVHRIFS
jgi:hypothetical protein